MGLQEVFGTSKLEEYCSVILDNDAQKLTRCVAHSNKTQSERRYGWGGGVDEDVDIQ